MAEDSWTKPTVTDGVTPTTGNTFWSPILNVIDRLAHKAARNAAGFSLDADTVSGAGIGVQSPVTLLDWNTLVKGGKYVNCGANAPGGYVGFTFYAEVIGQSVGYLSQHAYLIESGLAGSVYERHYNGNWSTWLLIYDRSNGGQPPEAKSRGMAGITKDTIGVGQSWTEDLVNGASVVRPNCGGTVHLLVLTYGSSLGIVDWTGGADGGVWGTMAGAGRLRWKRISQ